MTVGVILVSYNTGPALLESLQALLGAARAPGAPVLRVLVVDNASPDATEASLNDWAGTHAIGVDRRDFRTDGCHGALAPIGQGAIGFLQAGDNRGFAAGVNLGLRTFAAIPDVHYFWILNSDAITAPQTPAALLRAAHAMEASGGFGILGGRVCYADPPGVVQSDGGRIDWPFGRIRPINLGLPDSVAKGPIGRQLDYISGAHMFVSRPFLEEVGPMPEDYFLYYEEVDWCLRGKDHPLRWVEDAPVTHFAGASIGSQRPGRGPSAASAYWMARNRIRFVRKWRPMALPTTYAFAVGKIFQLALRGQISAAVGAAKGTFGHAL